eukprot:scaffold5832_cov109-Isochrysis_galbana.AAC.4
MQHHSQRLSRAAVMADAKAICKKLASYKQQACLLPRLSPPPLLLPAFTSCILHRPLPKD